MRAPPDQIARAFEHIRAGDVAAAERALLALSAQHPSDPAPHSALAQLSALKRDLPAAAAHLREACRLAPEDAQLVLGLGRMLAAMGDFSGARASFDRATRLDPRLFDAWFLLGVTHMRNLDRVPALSPLREAHRLRPDHPDAMRALADAEFHAGSPGDALPLWRRVVALRPTDIDARLKLGETCSRLGLHADAVAIYLQGTRDFPDSPDLWIALAQAQEDAGNRGEAMAAYNQAAVLKPDSALPLSGLLGLQRGDAPQALVARARTLQERRDLSDPERALLGYALGKVQDTSGAYEEAMASWNDANAARRRMIGAYDRSFVEDHVRQLTGVFDRGFFERNPARGSSDERPVFVVGMPRSGTTLTEQIIASHPDAFGCGELPDIPLILNSLGKDWPANAPALAEEVLRQCAERYIEAAARHAPPGKRRLVDKAPLNYFNLGLIALLFPEARVIWCRRDPRDIALSIYSENFSLDATFATDLADIGHYIRLQVDLMRHWQSVVPLPILEFSYEALVDSPEAEARRLIEFVGLDWNPACLDFHRSGRGVQTPSRWQVREPVHRRSSGRWRNYAAALASAGLLPPTGDEAVANGDAS